MVKLDEAFYADKDVLKVAKALLGKILVTEIDGIRTAGKIVETEAYNGALDRASHAWNNRRTGRTEVMFGPGVSTMIRAASANSAISPAGIMAVQLMPTRLAPCVNNDSVSSLQRKAARKSAMR